MRPRASESPSEVAARGESQLRIWPEPVSDSGVVVSGPSRGTATSMPPSAVEHGEHVTRTCQSASSASQCVRPSFMTVLPASGSFGRTQSVAAFAAPLPIEPCAVLVRRRGRHRTRALRNCEGTACGHPENLLQEDSEHAGQ